MQTEWEMTIEMMDAAAACIKAETPRWRETMPGAWMIVAIHKAYGKVSSEVENQIADYTMEHVRPLMTV